MDWADFAVEALEANVLDRRGWKRDWAQLAQDDPELREEILRTWAEIIRQAWRDAYEMGAPPT